MNLSLTLKQGHIGMPHNILVSKNYHITDHSKWYNDRSNEQNIAENYTAMERLLVDSAQQNIQDLDSVIIHRGEVATVRDLFKVHFEEIYSLWKRMDCNILYADLDVVFAKPSKYFGQFDKFTMFNLTDPPRTYDSHYNIKLDYFFNCGIRYYPCDMDQSVWDLGFQMLDNWNPDRYDSEQVVYNAMMFSQDPDPQKYYQPDLAYQVLTGNRSANDRFNQLPQDHAKTFHVHGSRGSGNRLEIMQTLMQVKSDLI